jgi:peptidoglycan/LPS O-acetylase OafA/YrhL
MKKVHFPGLNGLRFLAAFGVILHHLEQIKSLHGFQSVWSYEPVERLGAQCVSFFFVLSGFLITYLLLEEAHEFGDIAVGKFYVRRMLRIWPLYFLITALGFFVLPAFHAYDVPTLPLTDDADFWKKLGYYLVFSPHVEAVFLPGVSYAGVLWSVGVEEWFYAFWPWLVKYARKFLTPLLVAIVLLPILLRSHAMPPTVKALFDSLRFDCMAMGGLGAVLLRRGGARAAAWLRRLYHPATQVVVYGLLAVSLATGRSYGSSGGIIYSLLFGAVILNVATNPGTIFRLEGPAWRWLGEISFGLYCYNWIAITTAILLVKPWTADIAGLPANAEVSLLAFGLTVLFAAVSYYAYERPFLRLKRRTFTRVVTVPEKAN